MSETTKDVRYPAIMVIGRWDRYDQEAVVIQVRSKVIHDDDQAEAEFTYYSRLRTMGGTSYDYRQLASLGTEDRIAAEIQAQLEFEHGLRDSPDLEDNPDPGPPKGEAGEGAASPASESESRTGESDQDHSTTDNGNGQGHGPDLMGTVALVVRYKGMAPWPRETFMSGRLVKFYRDGQEAEPPARSVGETRLAIQQQGYEPDWTGGGWRITDGMNDVHGQERYERYRLNGRAAQRPPLEPVDVGNLAALAEQAGIEVRGPMSSEKREQLLALAAERNPDHKRADPLVDPWHRTTSQAWRESYTFGW